MAYLLDANVLLEAKNQHYGMDFCPAFWRWLSESHAGGRVFSVVEVRNELTDPEISPWVAVQSPDFFLAADPEAVGARQAIELWARDMQYTPEAMREFLKSADIALVAYAMAHGHVVVTMERSSGSKKKVKIPDACEDFNVRCIKPHVMLRELQARFVLGPVHEPYEGSGWAHVDPEQQTAADSQEALLCWIPTGTA
ncbi:DUF4411 family protein [Mitsuaria sp. GD03876]|uniref:DUF4411 family protein n=1 Tax=Mitsuaria sp. GD03876 TaxID=2975399 RepID=UPI00244846E9|nr:DUF4411 family protein [Mitsuaria sp. GD03876]MDH0867321.1 DUF4411 family protein [Mitsuaria sp. GD03876]